MKEDQIDWFESFDAVAYVEYMSGKTKAENGGAVGLWGLEKATQLFIGKAIVNEAKQRELKGIKK